MGRISTGLGTSWESALTLGFFVFCLSSLSVRCFQRAVESFRALERARGAVGPRGFILLSQPHTHIVQSPYYTHTKFTYVHHLPSIDPSTDRSRSTPKHRARATDRASVRERRSLGRSVAIVEANRCGARWTRRRAVVTLGRDRRRRRRRTERTRRDER